MPAAVAAAAAAAASGGALLLYLLLACRPAADGEGERAPLLPGRDSGGEGPWPDRAPATCCEAASVAARTARRTWELTVGRWGLRGIAFGITRHMRRQVREAAPLSPPAHLAHSVRVRVLPVLLLLVSCFLCFISGSERWLSKVTSR
jgi:hypothetical protein